MRGKNLGMIGWKTRMRDKTLGMMDEWGGTRDKREGLETWEETPGTRRGTRDKEKMLKKTEK